jgi:hypothetical protein
MVCEQVSFFYSTDIFFSQAELRRVKLGSTAGAGGTCTMGVAPVAWVLAPGCFLGPNFFHRNHKASGTTSRTHLFFLMKSVTDLKNPPPVAFATGAGTVGTAYEVSILFFLYLL